MNISTEALNGGKPLVRSGMASIPHIGAMGTLISLGGASGVEQNLTLGTPRLIYTLLPYRL
jgi:hypothetical protein